MSFRPTLDVIQDEAKKRRRRERGGKSWAITLTSSNRFWWNHFRSQGRKWYKEKGGGGRRKTLSPITYWKSTIENRWANRMSWGERVGEDFHSQPPRSIGTQLEREGGKESVDENVRTAFTKKDLTKAHYALMFQWNWMQNRGRGRKGEGKKRGYFWRILRKVFFEGRP